MTEKHRQPPARAEADEIELGQLVDILLNGKWLIIALTLIAGLAGFGYAMLSTSIYQGDALLQVETPRQMIPGLQELGLGGENSSSAAEMEVLRSRMLLGSVVDRLDLTIQAEPRHFPVIGPFLARRHGGVEPAPPRFGAEGYAWGGERISVTRLEPGPYLEGGTLVLTALGDGRYAVATEDGEPLGEGRVDEPLELRYNGQPLLALFVAELHARPGTEFLLSRTSRLEAIEALRRSLSISERGRDTGILAVTMEHPDTGRIRSVLDALTQQYVRQNVERRGEEASRSLEFLEGHLPDLRQELEAAEQDLNTFRRENQAVDLEADTRSLLGKVVEVEQELAEMRVQETELRLNYGPDHPRMQGMANRRASLQAIKEELEGQVAGLPDKQQQALRLRREVEVSTALYTGLLNTAQELRVVRAGTVGNVRILDEAEVAPDPVRPRRALILALSVVLGGMLGVMAVFGRVFLRRGITDPDSMEHNLGRPVYAVVPHSVDQVRSARRAKARKEPFILLARDKPQDPVVESLRSLRTSLTFALMRETRNVLMVTSPGPGSGKTFLSVNLAWLLAESGQRILLIDADMRRGHIHKYLPKRDRTPGLSDVLAGKAALDDAKVSLQDGRLDILTAGTIPPNPSELLMQESFRELLAGAERAYDLVVIDTAPVLAVTDAAIAGTSAGATLLLARAGYTGEREMQASIHRLEQGTVKVSGLVLNDFRPKQAAGGYNQYYYYDYKYSTEKRG
jgi:tyrosine-protein kinase Etk/Wzc